MNVVVNDTNIFIDLMSVGLLEETFRLPLKFHTVDFIVDEIKDDGQKAQLEAVINRGLLYVKDFDENELSDILDLFDQNSSDCNVSFPDCSVWYYAKKNNFRLLTGDATLRKRAVGDGIVVSGVLYLTDMLVSENIVERSDMAEKLRMLMTINSRLPKKLIESRINEYEQ